MIPSAAITSSIPWMKWRWWIRLLGVGPGLGRGDLGGLEHRVLDVAAASGVALRQRREVHVVGQRCLPGVELHPPDPLPRLGVGHLEEDVGADPALEGGVDVGGQVGGEDDHAGEALQLVQQHVHHRVGLALVGRVHGGEAPAGDGVGLVEEEDRVLPLGGPEHRGHVLGRLPHPAGLQLGVAHHQQLLVQRVRERLGADGLAGAGRSGEVERQAQPGGVTLGQAPLVEDQVVLPHQRERVVERPEGRRRQHHVVEGAPRLHRLDQLPAGRPEEQIADRVGHGGNLGHSRGSVAAEPPLGRVRRHPVPGVPYRLLDLVPRAGLVAPVLVAVPALAQIGLGLLPGFVPDGGGR